jgi:hypothetical protein
MKWILVLIFIATTGGHSTMLERYDYEQVCEQAARQLRTETIKAACIPAGDTLSDKAREQASAPFEIQPPPWPSDDDPDVDRLVEIRAEAEKKARELKNPPPSLLTEPDTPPCGFWFLSFKNAVDPMIWLLVVVVLNRHGDLGNRTNWPPVKIVGKYHTEKNCVAEQTQRNKVQILTSGDEFHFCLWTLTDRFDD